MIDSLGLRVLAEQKGHTRGSRALIRLDSKPLEIGDSPTTNELVKSTDFFYLVRFKPTNASGFQDRPFLLRADVLPGEKIRFRNIMGLEKIAQENKAVRWLMKWTNLSADILRLALYNSFTDIALRFDAKKYSEYIMSQLPEDTPNYYGVFLPKNEAIIETKKKEIYWSAKKAKQEQEKEKKDDD